MKRFILLINELESSVSQNDKVSALVYYLEHASDEDRIWAIALIHGKRPKRIITLSKLKIWAEEVIDLPGWLIEKSCDIVGDISESIALLLPVVEQENIERLTYYMKLLVGHIDSGEEQKKLFIIEAWSGMSNDSRFLFNKLITGGFRINIQQGIIIKALSKVIGIEEAIIAHRLMEKWSPLEVSFSELLIEDKESDSLSYPYPFYNSYAFEGGTDALGKIGDWYAERKWDGIRGQLIKRKNQVFIWSGEEELITDKLPEFLKVLDIEEEDFVLDGELVCFKEGKILSYNDIQTRLRRKNITKKHTVDFPTIMIAYDILEYKSEDLRSLPLYERRTILELVVKELESTGVILLSDLLSSKSWSHLEKERENSRLNKARGIMLKKKNSIYKEGRKRGDWWKWKVDPLTVVCVMIYAQRGDGGRASQFTDFTFGVWNEERELVSVAKTNFGLRGLEITEISQWVKKNTRERFGPVSVVNPVLVFELTFKGISPSSRHKSGLALREIKIDKWCREKTSEEADTLNSLKVLL